MIVVSPQMQRWVDGVRQVEEERRAMAREALWESNRSARELWATAVLERVIGAPGFRAPYVPRVSS